jgi:hypothetical protein
MSSICSNQLIGNVFLPSSKTIDIFFMRQIMTGEKKVRIGKEASNHFNIVS